MLKYDLGNRDHQEKRSNEIYLAEQNKAWKGISSLIMKMSEEKNRTLGWFVGWVSFFFLNRCSCALVQKLVKI